MVLSDLISVFTFLHTIVKDFNDPADKELGILEMQIRRAWDEVRVVVESHLKGNETEEVRIKDIETLISFCYDAEDLAEIKKHEHRFKVALNKLIKKNKIYVEFGKIEDLLTMLRNQSNTTSRQDNICADTSILPNPSIIGREDDKKTIIEMLTSCEKQGISIVGMYGVGKSSLARNIYNDQQIKDVFPCRHWYDVKDGNFNLDNIREYLLKDLSPEKFNLIVIDNLLVVKEDVWNGFLNLIKPYNVSLMVTTRSRTISRWKCFSYYDLGLLTDCSCANVIIETNANLSKRNLGIVAPKCQGLPVVANWLGNVIGLNRDECTETIFESGRRLSEEAKFKREIFPQLMSSYIGITTEQMRCLAYFSLFPEGHPFDIDELVHLWIGECFIKPKDQESLKGIKKKYGDWLQEKFILQPLGKLNCFVQDYAILAASQTCLRLGEGKSNEKTRHLSFSCNDFNNDSWSAVPKDKKLGKKLRSFLSLCNDNKNAGGQILKVPPNFWKKVSRLRVLSFKGLNIDEIPGCIENLKYLQYFNISFTPVKNLPKEVCCLQALKFLKLNNSKFSHLLNEFHKLTNLIYIDWDESTLRSVGIPCSIGKLSKLESLPLFKVGNKEGYLISELKEMNKLQGTLQIMDLQRVKSYEEATKAMLKDKRALTTIILEWNSNSNGSAENVLRGLELNENVKELKLIKYDGEKFPDWIKDSNLEKIHLKECGSLDFFLVLGKLKYLKTLILEDMESITELSCRSSDDTQEDDRRFPELESLELYNLTQLQRLTGLQARDMPHLGKFTAVGCHEIARLFSSNPRKASEQLKSIFEGTVWRHEPGLKIDNVVKQDKSWTGKRKWGEDAESSNSESKITQLNISKIKIE